MTRLRTARDFPSNTCPASRHLARMADLLPRRGGCPMLTEEPAHCAESMRSTVESLWRARTALRKIQALDPQSEAARIAREAWPNFDVFPEELEARVAALTMETTGT
jgi:hypothetical protein